MAKSRVAYVPILKTKAGERWALSHLRPATRASIRPLLEFHEHKDKSTDEHVAGLCDDLVAEWGTDRTFYLDGRWLHGDGGDPSVLATIFAAAQERDLRAVPVVRPTFDESTLEQVRAIVEAGGRGYMLRVGPAVLDDPHALDAVTEAIGLPPGQVDLLLDYRNRPMSLGRDARRVPRMGEWRRLVAASGAFPSSLAGLTLHEWHGLPRHDWLSWRDGIAGDLPRRPVYADYAMRDPGAPADFGSPSVNVRYATDTAWLVQVGGKVKDGASPEMHALCRALVERPEFTGVDFSAGDAELARVADADEGPGNSTQWLQWCVNHHLEFTVRQLSSGEAAAAA
jgi:hypothetical protein